MFFDDPPGVVCQLVKEGIYASTLTGVTDSLLPPGPPGLGALPWASASARARESEISTISEIRMILKTGLEIKEPRDAQPDLGL